MLNTQNTQNCVEAADVEVFDENFSLDYIDPQEYSAEQYLQLCWDAVKQNADNFCFVDPSYFPGDDDHKNRKYFEIAEFAISKDYFNINYVKFDFLTYGGGLYDAKENYYELCTLAVEHKSVLNDRTLKYIKAKYLDLHHYLILVFKCLAVWVGNIKYIDTKFFNKEVYFDLVKSLLKKSPFLLRRIKVDFLPNKNRDYYHLCKMVVEKNRYDSIRYVKGDELSKSEYYQLCLIALKRSIGNICHIEPKHLTAEHYLQCCREIAKKRCYLEVIEREFLPKKYQDISLFSSESYDILLK